MRARPTDPTLTRKFVGIVDCMPAPPDDHSGGEIWLLKDDPGIRCWECPADAGTSIPILGIPGCKHTADYLLLLFVGMIGVVVYCFGFPLIATLLIRSYQSTKDDINLPRSEKQERYERVVRAPATQTYPQTSCSSPPPLLVADGHSARAAPLSRA